MRSLCCRIDRGSQLIIDGYIRGIPAKTGCHISVFQLGLRGTEGIPAATHAG